MCFFLYNVYWHICWTIFVISAILATNLTSREDIWLTNMCQYYQHRLACGPFLHWLHRRRETVCFFYKIKILYHVLTFFWTFFVISALLATNLMSREDIWSTDLSLHSPRNLFYKMWKIFWNRLMLNTGNLWISHNIVCWVKVRNSI